MNHSTLSEHVECTGTVRLVFDTALSLRAGTSVGSKESVHCCVWPLESTRERLQGCKGELELDPFCPASGSGHHPPAVHLHSAGTAGSSLQLFCIPRPAFLCSSQDTS